jgi:branched-chain amino acid aminotransferase
MKINLNPNLYPASDADRGEKVAAGGFGKYYTDNMVIAEWSELTGWGEADLKAYGPLSIDPAMSVLHYGQEIFEGLKAYSQPVQQPMRSVFARVRNVLRFQSCQSKISWRRLKL